MSISVVDDLELSIFNSAGLLHLYVRKHGAPRTLDHPAFCVLSDFLLHTVLVRSVRTSISSAETNFLLEVWMGKMRSWPMTFPGACLFLRRWLTFMSQFVIKDNVKWLWMNGFLFFGTPAVIRLAFTQLNLNIALNDKHIVIAASNCFFDNTKEERSTRHLSYCLYNEDTVSSLSAKFLPLYSLMPVVCAMPLANQMYSVLRQRIKETLGN